MSERRTPSDIDPFKPTGLHDSAIFELAPGAMVGDYEIVGKIGEGGMGMVFSAVHPVIGKRAAVKVLKHELCADRTELARFIDEARSVNKIGHPNIVDIFMLGQLPDGRSYLVMEWLAGEPLRARLGRSRPDLEETSYILRSLARALDAAHEKGIVHRDLKPDNVFLVAVRGDRPMVKLLDFGIAKLLHPDQRIDRTATNQIIGTPLYIAPEQARAETVDHHADIYALGAMTFEMITGAPPFGGKSAMEVIAKHMLERAPRLSSQVEGLPDELDDLIAAMLDKAPANRPSLATFVATLDRLGPALRSAEIRVRAPISEVRDTAVPMSPVTPPATLLGSPPIREPGVVTPMPALSAPVPESIPPPIEASLTPMPATATATTATSTATPVPGSLTLPPETSPPAVAVTWHGDAPRRRRWMLPLLGGAALAVGLVTAFVLVRGDDEKDEVEPPKPTTDTTNAKPEPTPPAPAKAEPAKTEPAKTNPVKAEPANTTKAAKKIDPKPVDPNKKKIRPPIQPPKADPPSTTDDDNGLLKPGTVRRGGGRK